MVDYRERFRVCGKGVEVADDVYIEHPEVMDVGDGVRFMKGFYMVGGLRRCRIGANVVFYPGCFVQGIDSVFEIGEHVEFFPGCYVSIGQWESSFIRIGDRSHFSPHCAIYGWGGLTVGRYCNLAAHVVLATVGHHHELTDRPMALTGEKAKPVVLEEDVWIGCNATVTSGVTVARGCVVGAGAVVTKDTESMCIYAGVPALRVCRRGENGSFHLGLLKELDSKKLQ